MRTDYDLPIFEDYIGVINDKDKNFYFIDTIDNLIKKIHKIRRSNKLMITSCSKNVSLVWDTLYPKINKYSRCLKKPY